MGGLSLSLTGGLSVSSGASYGPELITNGGFDTDTAWTKEASWTIASGVATYTPDGATHSLYQSEAIVSGRTYEIRFDITSRSGDTDVQATLQGVETSGSLTAVQRHTVQLTAAANRANILFYGSGSSGSLSIDNVTVREVL